MGNFFKNFPDIDYEYTPGILKKSVDILRRTDVTSRLLDSNQYDQVILRDGQTPQSAAINYYNDVSLHWSFFITNRLINPFYDWPQSYEKLNKRVDSKYAGVSLYVTENSNGLTMDTQSVTSSYSIGDTVNVSTGSDNVVGYSSRLRSDHRTHATKWCRRSYRRIGFGMDNYRLIRFQEDVCW